MATYHVETENGSVYEVQTEDSSPEYSKPESFLGGAAQGATLGFADEGSAAISTLPELLKGKLSLQELVDTYRKNRDLFRGRLKSAQEQNPKSYLGGEFAGSAATALIPGMPEATIGNAVKMGALQGIGNSEADLLNGDAANVGKDALRGAALGGILGSVVPAAQKAYEGAKWGAKKALSTFLGPTEEAISRYVENPSLLESAPIGKLAEDFPRHLDHIKDLITVKEENAQNALSDIPSIELAPILEKINQLKNSLKIGNENDSTIFGNSDKRAFDVLNNYIKRLNPLMPERPFDLINNNLKKSDEKLSEKSVNSIIKDLSQDTNWTNPEYDVSNESLKTLRNYLSTILKEKNKTYAHNMSELAPLVELSNSMRRAFSLKRATGEGFVPSDTTGALLENALKEKKVYSNDLLSHFDDLLGENYRGKIKDSILAKQFVGGKINGSRSVNQMMGMLGPIGAAAGAMAGGPVEASIGAGAGAAAGAALGSYIDKHGGEMASQLIDFALKNNPEKLGKYAAPLLQAAQRGGQGVSVSHYVLMNNDPEYRKMVHDLEESK